jgi:hypothetical protein
MSKRTDVLTLVVAIQADDEGATIKKLAAEVKAVFQKYEHGDDKPENTYLTDSVLMAWSVPSIVYAMGGGVPGIMAKAARDLKTEIDNRSEADDE